MASIDLTSINETNAQIMALEQSLASAPPGPAHDIIAAQIVGLQATMKSKLDNAQQQNNAWSNILNGVGLLSTLGLVGGSSGMTPISSILTIFKKG